MTESFVMKSSSESIGISSAFKYPHKKKKIFDKFGECAGQMIYASRPIHRGPKVALR